MVKVSLTKDIFWGVTIDGNKRYSQTVEQPFHVSMAALDCREKGQGDANGCVSVMLEHGGAEFLLCTLQRGRIFQQKLDLEFAHGESLTLYLVGKGTVHLTGYLVADIEEDLAQSMIQDSASDEDEEGADSEEASVDEPCNVDSKKAAKKSALKAVRNDQDSDEDDDVSLDDEDYDENDDDEDKSDDDDDDDDEDEKEDDDSEDESDEDDSDEDETPAAKRFKPSGETPKSTSGATKAAKSELKQKQSTPVRPANQKTGSVQRQVEFKDTKAATGDTDKKKKKDKSDKAANVSVNSQASSTASPAVTKLPMPTKTPVTPMPQAATTSSGQRKSLSGGVTMEEIRIGNGPEAKSGKTAHVYYTGQLASGKVFDKKTSDKPFSFRLGKNEVIKGWDVGVAGMKVGGKRRLVIPPHMGYGKEKAGSIPPNSTLTFEVELRAVS